MRRIQSELASRHFSLLEALAEHIAQILLNEFKKAPWAKISVAQLQAIRGSKMAGIALSTAIEIKNANFDSHIKK